eukprot:6484000-Amphidinium_carterae.1
MVVDLSIGPKQNLQTTFSGIVQWAMLKSSLNHHTQRLDFPKDADVERNIIGLLAPICHFLTFSGWMTVMLVQVLNGKPMYA